MIQHYITIAVRNLLKYKTQTLVCMIGLAIGLAASSLSGMWLKYNLTYDSHWPESERIYLLQKKDNYDTRYVEFTPNALAGFIQEHLPEAECCGRLIWDKYVEVENTYIEITCIDSCTLRMFPIRILKGSPDFHRHPNQYALSESTAMKLFGTTDIIGKELKKNNQDPESAVFGTITALFEDVKGHSNFSWDILNAVEPLQARSYTTSDGKEVNISPWNQVEAMTLVRFYQRADIEQAKRKLNTKLQQIESTYIDSIRFIPLKDFKNREGQFYTVQLEHIRMFCLTGGLIVISAILNYLILYAIRIRMRVREMTLRKVHGASKLSLTNLLFTEIWVLMLCTYPLGMLILELTLPAFCRLSEIKEPLSYFYAEGTTFMLIVMAASLLLSLIVIQAQCRKTLQAGLRKDNLTFMRKVCLGIQLVISIGFIFCTVAMYKQLHHLHHSPDTGFKNTEVGFVHNSLYNVGPAEYEEMYQHMKQIPYIDAHAIYGMPFNSGGRVPLESWEGKQANDPEVIYFGHGFIDEDIFNHFGLQLVAGSIPSKDCTSNDLIISESAVKALGWSLEEALGKKLLGESKIIGIIKDLRLSPMEKPRPMIYSTVWQKNEIKSIVFTYEGSFKEVEKKLLLYFKEKCPHFFFSVTTPAIWIEHSLVSEKALLKLLVVASSVSILISLFGIFSLVNLSCERRRKEIALRKIHGAEMKDIISLFIREFGWILVLSALVAFPIGYAIMKQWMQAYVMQTDIPIWLYAGILLAIILLISLCVGYRIQKAAHENPAEVIKNE